MMHFLSSWRSQLAFGTARNLALRRPLHFEETLFFVFFFLCTASAHKETERGEAVLWLNRVKKGSMVETTINHVKPRGIIHAEQDFRRSYSFVAAMLSLIGFACTVKLPIRVLPL